MAIYVPQGPDFQWTFTSGIQSSPNDTIGTPLAPSTTVGSYGGWSEIASSSNISQEVYGIYIRFISGQTSGSARNILCEVGVDNAGGTSYVSVIPYLMAGGSTTYTSQGGISYYFPLYIKSGSSVAVRAMSNNFSALRVVGYFYGKPRRPDAVRAGSYVDAFGVDVNNRIGTSITPGTTSEGAWTQLGSATTRNYWWWQSGFGINNATFNGGFFYSDLSAGDDTNKKIINENQYWWTAGQEQISNIVAFQNCYTNVAIGQNIYSRAQASGTPTSGTTMIAYGLGG